MAQQPLMGQSPYMIETSRPHSDIPHSVVLLWTSDQPDTKTSTGQHTTLTKDKHPCPGGIRTRNPRKREAADPRLKQRGQWGRLKVT